MKNRWSNICQLEELAPDRGVCALVGDRQVAVFYAESDGRLYAIDNYDPTCEANVLSRGLMGELDGEPVVTSPLRDEHYSLATGRCIGHASLRLRTYRVRLMDQTVQIRR